jgi:hypothetical protein
VGQIFALGQRIGDWVIVDEVERLNHDARYLCQCICGTEKVLSAATLRRGSSLHCGCQKHLATGVTLDQKKMPIPHSIEDFDLIHKGYLPLADQVSPRDGCPTWSLNAWADILGITRSELIISLKAAGNRFESSVRMAE